MPFQIVRDARGALIHIRTESGECVGCIEVGLFEIVRMVITEEAASAGEGNLAPTASAAILARRSDDDPPHC